METKTITLEHSWNDHDFEFDITVWPHVPATRHSPPEDSYIEVEEVRDDMGQPVHDAIWEAMFESDNHDLEKELLERIKKGDY